MNRSGDKFTHTLSVTLDDTDRHFVDTMCDELGLSKTELFRFALDRLRRDRSRKAAELSAAGRTKEEIRDQFQVDPLAVLLRKIPY